VILAGFEASRSTYQRVRIQSEICRFLNFNNITLLVRVNERQLAFAVPQTTILD